MDKQVERRTLASTCLRPSAYHMLSLVLTSGVCRVVASYFIIHRHDLSWVSTDAGVLYYRELFFKKNGKKVLPQSIN